MPLSEFALIERYFRHCGVKRADVRLGIGDDAALLETPPDADLVASIDTLVAGVHFPERSPPASIGHRALAVNLSDLAAMGARPAWALLALTLPEADEAWLGEFARGLGELARTHKVALVGGDTTRGPLCITVQLLGYLPTGAALNRGGAHAGDVLFVSGRAATRPPDSPSSNGGSPVLPRRATGCASVFSGLQRVWRSASSCVASR